MSALPKHIVHLALAEVGVEEIDGTNCGPCVIRKTRKLSQIRSRIRFTK